VLLTMPAFSATSYRFAAIWDGTKVWKDSCITVEGERIRSIGTCVGTPVDLSRYTAIPGLIDVHTHMTYVWQNPVTQAGRRGAGGWSYSSRRRTRARRWPRA